MRTDADAERLPEATAGAPRCIATIPPDGTVCGAAATVLVVWPDPDPNTSKSPACAACARRLLELARSHGSSLGFDSIVGF
jgi:hypothetical protein